MLDSAAPRRTVVEGVSPGSGCCRRRYGTASPWLPPFPGLASACAGCVAPPTGRCAAVDDRGRAYPWGRRYPPIVTYAVRGDDETRTAFWAAARGAGSG